VPRRSFNSAVAVGCEVSQAGVTTVAGTTSGMLSMAATANAQPVHSKRLQVPAHVASVPGECEAPCDGTSACSDETVQDSHVFVSVSAYVKVF
jgi:hypothetical protein